MIDKLLNLTKRQKTTEERRALLIQSAISCFIEKGIGQTGIRDIAAKANVSVGNLYNHFASKDMLIAEIAKIESAGLHCIFQKVAKTDDPMKALAIFAKEYLTYTSSLTSAVLTIEIMSEALRNDDIAKLFDGNGAALLDCLSTIIHKGQKRQIFLINTGAEKTAQLLIDMIEGMGIRLGLSGLTATKADHLFLNIILQNTLKCKG